VNLLDSWDVLLIIGVGINFIVCRDISFLPELVMDTGGEEPSSLEERSECWNWVQRDSVSGSEPYRLDYLSAKATNREYDIKNNMTSSGKGTYRLSKR
jgi:hypothetical protein